MVERRNKFQIITDILKIISEKEKIKVTHILYGSNLSYDRLKKYLFELQEKQMIEEMEEINKKRTKTFYKITEKGFRFLAEAQKIKEITDAFGL